MKSLFILRHAKSSWDDASLSDFDRPLNDRGLSAAPFMGEVMARRGYHPELILSSPAERAKQTAILVKDAACISADIKYDEKIYEASPQTVVQTVAEVSEKLNSIMLVGHNPGSEGLIRYLTGRSVSMPTAALAAIELDINAWKDISNGCGTLVEVIRPKEERDGSGKGAGI